MSLLWLIYLSLYNWNLESLLFLTQRNVTQLNVTQCHQSVYVSYYKLLKVHLVRDGSGGFDERKLRESLLR